MARIEENEDDLKSDESESTKPFLFDSPEELQEQIDLYFKDCDKTVVKQVLNKAGDIVSVMTKPYTVSGLASFLKTSRQLLINYQGRKRYGKVVNEAKARIEAGYEERGLIGDCNPAVTIFTLKNNYGWKDKQEEEIKQDTAKTIIINTYGDKPTTQTIEGV